MDNTSPFFIKLKGILVSQPLGDFILCKISARDLLSITFSYEHDSSNEEEVNFSGTQRRIKTEKAKQIGNFIDTVEASFPNSIILAANYNTDGEPIDNPKNMWTYNRLDNDYIEITIPTSSKTAAIVDGQHRIEGFKYSSISERLDTELPCSIYFDLPIPYQAYLFSLINSTQTQVSKNLTYNLQGFNLEDESSTAWSPEKLAVFMTRKLNFDISSPLYRKIKITPQIDKKIIINTDWTISTSTMVQGIVSLISKKPSKDRDILAQIEVKHRTRGALEEIFDDSPLRGYYLLNNDIVIEKCVLNFFTAFTETVIPTIEKDSFILKNVGIKALFTLLRNNLKSQIEAKKIDVSVNYFTEIFNIIKSIDFSGEYFKVPSAVGISRMENAMLIKLKLKEIDAIKKNEDKEILRSLLNI